jgi:cyanophycin synthetase
MELIEVRDLDGPNLFALRPVLKLEIRLGHDDRVSPEARESSSRILSADIGDDPLNALQLAIAQLHRFVGLDQPDVATRPLDAPGHTAIYYDWTWRETALEIGRLAFQAVERGLDADPTEVLERLLRRDIERDDQPIWIRDDRRRIPSIGITGTNGKTTTTRMIAHILRTTGAHVGWTSTSGVYIDGEQVIDGDYTGPSGARRVLEDATVEIAVLETARGGILLRGLAYESNDVGVFINVSADHLDMHGVATVESLAEVKSVVVRVTRPEGLVVLNADDPLVLAQAANVQAPVLMFSQSVTCEPIAAHIAAGGAALASDGAAIVRWADGEWRKLVDLNDVPATYGGAARHMVENALAATGATLGMNVSEEQIVSGLTTFRSDIRSNAGRLNVFRLDGRVVVVDYAHNEQGLEMLLGFARRMAGDSGRVATVIGTAGDRTDEQLRGLGVIAAELADRVYLKETSRYLRGREPGDVTGMMLVGVLGSSHPDRLVGSFDGELDAFLSALGDSSDGDVIAIMCLEEQLTILRELRDRGAEEWE